MAEPDVTLTLTAEQAEVLKPLLDRPDRMVILITFIDNMLAAKVMAKIIAWTFGVLLACLTAYYYFASIFNVKGPHGVP